MAVTIPIPTPLRHDIGGNKRGGYGAVIRQLGESLDAISLVGGDELAIVAAIAGGRRP